MLRSKQAGLLFLSISFLVEFCKSSGKMAMVGGAGQVQPADAEIQLLVHNLKASVEEKSNARYEEFEAVSYRSQVVAGTNYFIKVKVGNDQYIHMKVFKPLPYTKDPATLTSYKAGKTLNDEIDPREL
ncbi:cystatin-A1-like [Argopecten irradians]|uniref:cystatin-A1-like n=1 Tax=Argopecten irradians TaxID=31199 RepID=UPI003724AF91